MFVHVWSIGTSDGVFNMALWLAVMVWRHSLVLYKCFGVHAWRQHSAGMCPTRVSLCTCVCVCVSVFVSMCLHL